MGALVDDNFVTSPKVLLDTRSKELHANRNLLGVRIYSLRPRSATGLGVGWESVCPPNPSRDGSTNSGVLVTSSDFSGLPTDSYPSSQARPYSHKVLWLASELSHTQWQVAGTATSCFY